MRSLLFVCNHNAGRSQMAHAFAERLAPDDLRVTSAGTAPARRVWPAVVEAMREIGLDLTARTPTRLIPEMQFRADWAVTLGCGEVCPYVPAAVEAWDVSDPAGQPLERVREIRDEVERRVEELLSERLELIRSDRTAHEVRLARLLPALVTEFDGSRDPAEIRSCADLVLETFSTAEVRTYVPVLAERRTRACLRAEGCDPWLSGAPS